MARKTPHIGASFESWLDDAGIREEVTAAAIKAVIARRLASEMKKKKITKQLSAAPGSGRSAALFPSSSPDRVRRPKAARPSRGNIAGPIRRG